MILIYKSRFFHIKVEVPKHHSSQEIIYNLMDDSYIQIKCSDGFGLQKPGLGWVRVRSESDPSQVRLSIKLGFSSQVFRFTLRVLCFLVQVPITNQVSSSVWKIAEAQISWILVDWFPKLIYMMTSISIYPTSFFRCCGHIKEEERKNMATYLFMPKKIAEK